MMTSEKMIPCACGQCNQLIPEVDRWGASHRFVAGHQNRGRKHPGDKNPSWKGGKIIRNGCNAVYRPEHPRASKDGYVYIGILAYEDYYRCCTGTVMLHKNNNKQDDDVSNIEILTRHKYYRLSPKGPNHPGWKGGMYVTHGAYVMIRRSEHHRASKSGYVRQHILVMEEMLGRPLRGGETVHHKNGIKSDNRKCNLELFSSNSEHIMMHANSKSELEKILQSARTLRHKFTQWLKNGQVCPQCSSDFVGRVGHQDGKQVYRCVLCRKRFQR